MFSLLLVATVFATVSSPNRNSAVAKHPETSKESRVAHEHQGYKYE